MNPGALIASVIGLGAAGLDPVGALLVVSALAAGARRRDVMLFFATSALFTIAAGVLLGETVQFVIDWVGGLAVPDGVRLTVELAGAATLGWWAAHRWRHRSDPRPIKKKRSVLAGPFAMALAGAGWGITAVTDPSFLALIAVDSRVENLLVSTAVFTGWFLISQAPLCAIVLALGAGRDSPLVARALAMTQKLVAPAAVFLTVLLALTSLLLAVDSASYVLSGQFWPA